MTLLAWLFIALMLCLPALCMPPLFADCAYGCCFCTGTSGACITNVTVVVTGVTNSGFCTDCTTYFNTTWAFTTSAPGGTADCMNYSTTSLQCAGTNNYTFGFGTVTCTGANQSTVRVKLINGAGGVFAQFEYTLTGTIDCSTTNGPYTMTLVSSRSDTFCIGTTAAATIQIGP